jgi:hypothetical protein
MSEEHMSGQTQVRYEIVSNKRYQVMVRQYEMNYGEVALIFNNIMEDKTVKALLENEEAKLLLEALNRFYPEAIKKESIK